MKKSTLSPYSIPPILQRLFTYSALAVFTLPALHQIWLIALQIPNNPNLSGYYWAILNSIIAPIVMFVIAYFISDKKKPRSSRIFIGTFLATIGMMLLISIGTLVTHLTTLLMVTFDDAFWDWLNLEIAVTGSTLVLYTLLLLLLRRKKTL